MGNGSKGHTGAITNKGNITAGGVNLHFWNIHSVHVQADSGINYSEALCHVLDELTRWQERKSPMESIQLILANGGKEIKINTNAALTRRIQRDTREVLDC